MNNILALPAQSYVYVIGDPEGPQKVGFASDPKRRLAMFQPGNAGNLVISSATAVLRSQARDVERYAHWLLREHHARGEWFSVTPAKAKAAVEEAAAFVQAGNVVGYLGTHSDVMTIRFPEGDFARIDAVAGKNRRAKFIRDAVEAELKRQEKVAAKGKPKPPTP